MVAYCRYKIDSIVWEAWPFYTLIWCKSKTSNNINYFKIPQCIWLQASDELLPSSPHTEPIFLWLLSWHHPRQDFVEECVKCPHVVFGDIPLMLTSQQQSVIVATTVGYFRINRLYGDSVAFLIHLLSSSINVDSSRSSDCSFLS